jgi:hypothetical protein
LKNIDFDVKKVISKVFGLSFESKMLSIRKVYSHCECGKRIENQWVFGVLIGDILLKGDNPFSADCERKNHPQSRGFVGEC